MSLSPSVNVPWVESPFFGRQLAARPHLGPREIELVSFFHTNGYVILPDVLSPDLADRVMSETVGTFRDDVLEGYASYYRIHDAWKTSPAVKDVALHPGVFDALRLLYGREPVPFQTLNFRYGSEQVNHSDAILFNSLPERFMCGVWVALEDVDVENGPLFYHPGSQKLKQYYRQDFASTPGSPDDFFNQRYPHFIGELMQEGGFRKDVLRIAKGSALVWASNLVHGGMPRLDRSRTRWTQVTHYYFEGCVYYVPLYSDVVAGSLRLRDVVDMRTGSLVPQTYDGRPFRKVELPGGNHRLEILDEPPAAPGPVTRLETLSRAHGLVRGLVQRLLPRGPRLAPLPESESLRWYVDGFDDTPSTLSVFGWAFAAGAAATEVHVVLESGADRLTVEAVRTHRPDVGAAYPGAGDDTGFSLALDKKDVPRGTYRLGIQLRLAGGETVFRLTDRRMVVAG